MKKKEAKKVAIIVKREIHNLFDKLDDEDKMLSNEAGVSLDPIDRSVTLSINESKECKGHFGVHVVTDSDAYRLLYDIDNEEAHTNCQKIMSVVNEEMGDRFMSEEHYFEHEGAGVLILY